MPQLVIRPNHHMAALTVKGLKANDKYYLAYLPYPIEHGELKEWVLGENALIE